ncbi:patatin-like phospholipase family protein [Leifsonia sp. AG29]|uniref:patatin-like phospholipase family protein n=1 Tax=Leifsonia sp. AG29 TaxID=2598860 RepID=UPI00131DCBF2|nr:patatin-like phospholipase family protein [Leifsonia sp. AG29]
MNSPTSSPHSDPAHTRTGSTARPAERALVLGGGGSTGNAWLIGVVAGLAQGGLDVTAAELTVGTSAGATAAAQLAGASPAGLYRASLVAPPPRPAPPSNSGGASPARPAVTGVHRVQSIIDSAHDMDDMRRRMSASALELDAESDGSWSERWRAIAAGRLPGRDWPERRVLITAVDARTSLPVVFDRDSGIDIADAVAASTSSGLPLRLGDDRYIDGGFRINAENADLAAGAGRVLVLSPLGGRSLTPERWGVHLSTQLDTVRASGSDVRLVSPTAEAEPLFGVNGMDLSLRPAAARAGFEQGLDLAPALTPFWS